jgi:hypothetical protein
VAVPAEVAKWGPLSHQKAKVHFSLCLHLLRFSLSSACQTSAHGTVWSPAARLPRPAKAEGIYPPAGLREIVSQFLGTMQFRSLHSILPSGCLGVSDVLLLNDWDMIALYEHGSARLRIRDW